MDEYRIVGTWRASGAHELHGRRTLRVPLAPVVRTIAAAVQGTGCVRHALPT